MGFIVFVITRLKREDFEILDDFKKYGIKYQACSAEGTSGIRNIYNSSNLEVRDCKPIDFAGGFQKKEIPDNLQAKYFIVGPILAGEIDLELLKYIANRFQNKICLDIQGFIRIIKEDDIFFCELSEKEKQEILANVTILKTDHAELKALTGQEQLKEGAKALSTYGPEEILITHQKGISVYANEEFHSYPWMNQITKGRTGRGDTSFISYVGSRIKNNPQEALKFAAALTSLKLEMPGPYTLPLFNVLDKIKDFEDKK